MGCMANSTIRPRIIRINGKNKKFFIFNDEILSKIFLSKKYVKNSKKTVFDS